MPEDELADPDLRPDELDELVEPEELDEMPAALLTIDAIEVPSDAVAVPELGAVEPPGMVAALTYARPPTPANPATARPAVRRFISRSAASREAILLRTSAFCMTAWWRRLLMWI